jgi:hypothetical protein
MDTKCFNGGRARETTRMRSRTPMMGAEWPDDEGIINNENQKWTRGTPSLLEQSTFFRYLSFELRHCAYSRDSRAKNSCELACIRDFRPLKKTSKKVKKKACLPLSLPLNGNSTRQIGLESRSKKL